MRQDVGRPPTSHERMSGRPWDASYYDGPAPWDVGRPQPTVARLALEGGFTGTVLDAGCGTGENSLLVAALGLPVLGVDVAETALSMAREKAAERGIPAEFAWADALRLERLGRRFDTVLDCGLFHVIEDDERRRYVRELGHVLRPGGRHLMLGFATNPSGRGPRGYSPEELRAHFAEGFREVFIRPTSFQAANAPSGQAAWVSLFVRE